MDAIRVQALDGTVPTSDGLQWYSRNNAWRSTWIPTRIDLRFDASTFSELKEGSEVDMPAFAESLGAAMEEMVAATDLPPSRFGLVATGTISAGAEGVRGIAAVHLNDATQRAADAGELLEAQVRLNFPADWELGKAPVRVNRMLTKHAQWKLNAGEEERDLVVTFDVNTSPTHADRLTPSDVHPFMNQAAAWISQQMGAIGV